MKNSHLIIAVIVGIVVMTILVFNMQVKKEVADTILEQYQKGNVPEKAYKDALSDGKLTNWEALQLKK